MKRNERRMDRTGAPLTDWRSKLYRKTFVMEAWDWNENAWPRIKALCRPFSVRPRLSELDPESPETLLRALALAHRLHLYDAPTLEGSDVYGFILSKEKLSAREIQQIEADCSGQQFDEVYDPSA
jgi:hypothetical protein